MIRDDMVFQPLDVRRCTSIFSKRRDLVSRSTSCHIDCDLVVENVGKKGAVAWSKRMFFGTRFSFWPAKRSAPSSSQRPCRPHHSTRPYLKLRGVQLLLVPLTSSYLYRNDLVHSPGSSRSPYRQWQRYAVAKLFFSTALLTFRTTSRFAFETYIAKNLRGSSRKRVAA